MASLCLLARSRGRTLLLGRGIPEGRCADRTAVLPYGVAGPCGAVSAWAAAPLERKNGWTIAEHAREKEPKALQRFLNLTPWDADELRDIVLGYAMENFAEPRGVLIADPTGFAKKGTKSGSPRRSGIGFLLMRRVIRGIGRRARSRSWPSGRRRYGSPVPG